MFILDSIWLSTVSKVSEEDILSNQAGVLETLVVYDSRIGRIKVELVEKTNNYYDLVVSGKKESYLFPLDWELQKGRNIRYLAVRYFLIAQASLV